jgi:hypothetical protein
MVMLSLCSRQDSEFVANLVVVVDKEEFEAEADPLTVETALLETMAGGRLGHLKVDPNSLELDLKENGGCRVGPPVYIPCSCR